MSQARVMSIGEHIKLIHRRYGFTGAEQAAGLELYARRWDEFDQESHRQPGRWVPGVFAREAQSHREQAAEIRAWIAEHGDVA